MLRMKSSCVILTVVLAALAVAFAVQACDTFVAMQDATRDGIVTLGKNSDRPTFDCQPLVYHARKEWPEGAVIDLGRMSVPQVAETYATLGSSPYWCWGYEEGINEHSVAIGNEGVFTKPLAENLLASEQGDGPPLGPTGMDLIRLALERSRTAREALDVITGLVEQYGQFGSGAPTQGVVAAYDNSFIIADPEEAWILETAGTRWAARRLKSGVASISNRLAIGTDWDLASDDLEEHAIEKDWWQAEADGRFDFAQAYSADTGPAGERLERARIRQERSCALLEDRAGEIDTGWMKRIARDRATEPSIDLDETATSCVALLPRPEDGLPVFWWCAARPSVSCYVPFFVHGSALPPIVSAAGEYGNRVMPPGDAEADSFSPDSYWWLFRDLADLVSADWDKRHPVVTAEFDRLEAKFQNDLPEVLTEARRLEMDGDHAGRAALLDQYTASCTEEVVAKVNDLRERFAGEVVQVPAMYEPYIGIYIGNFGHFQEAEFEVKMQNGRLAVDVPGQTVFEMKDPDQAGRWVFALTDLIGVSFVEDVSGEVSAMLIHQTARIPRKDSEIETPPADAPEDLKPYVGQYSIAPGRGDIEVFAVNGSLALRIPDEPVISLKSPDPGGQWYFEEDPTTAVSFERDDTGRVIRLNLHQTFELPKKEIR